MVKYKKGVREDQGEKSNLLPQIMSDEARVTLSGLDVVIYRWTLLLYHSGILPSSTPEPMFAWCRRPL